VCVGVAGCSATAARACGACAEGHVFPALHGIHIRRARQAAGLFCSLFRIGTAPMSWTLGRDTVERDLV